MEKEGGGVFINMSFIEACYLIQGLAEQMQHNNPNAGRAEFRSDQGVYFSLAIDPVSSQPTEKDWQDHLFESALAAKSWPKKNKKARTRR